MHGEADARESGRLEWTLNDDDDDDDVPSVVLDADYRLPQTEPYLSTFGHSARLNNFST